MNAASSDPRALLAHARHELRTPVNAIIGYSEMLIEEFEDLTEEGERLQVLNEIRTFGGQLNSDISELMGEENVKDLTHEHLSSLEQRVRDRLQPQCQSVLAHCRVIETQSAPKSLDSYHDDIQRIASSAKRLGQLLSLHFTELNTAIQDASPTSPTETSSTITSPPPARPDVGLRALAGHALIVDDNALNRDMLARLLQRQDHTFSMAENGQQALQMMAEEDFDLILLDIMMPVMDGYETLRRIKADDNWKHLPVIMISALDEISSVVRCIELGAEDYLPKPFDAVLLKARVGACLEKKRLRDQELDYLRQVAKVTEAASSLEEGKFTADALNSVINRSDALGQLARVFVHMAQEVKAREEQLQMQVQQLKVEIDETRKTKQVEEITESDYFQLLQQKAQALRQKRKS